MLILKILLNVLTNTPSVASHIEHKFYKHNSLLNTLNKNNIIAVNLKPPQPINHGLSF